MLCRTGRGRTKTVLLSATNRTNMLYLETLRYVDIVMNDDFDGDDVEDDGGDFDNYVDGEDGGDVDVDDDNDNTIHYYYYCCYHQYHNCSYPLIHKVVFFRITFCPAVHQQAQLSWPKKVKIY